MARTRGGSVSGRGRTPRSTRSRNVETHQTGPRTPTGNIQQQQAFIMNALHMITGLIHRLAQNVSSGGTSTDTNATTNGEARGATHQQFMSLHPPKFHGKGTADDAEEWIQEIEEIFTTLEVPDNKKVRYGTFMLKGYANEWWQTQREVKFANHEASWEEFKEAFTHAYIPAFTREKRMQEFFELQQMSMSLHEYVVKFRHLEKYCPHVYTSDTDRANKFIRGLKDGLRSKVMCSRPQDLDDAIDMATRFDEDWNRTHGIDKRNEFLRSKSRPNMFKRRRSDRVNQGDKFKRQRPSSSRQDEECPKCHRQHPSKTCYRDVGACLYCGTQGHFICECPKKKEAEQMRGVANQPVEKKVLGRVYATTVEDLKSIDLIEVRIKSAEMSEEDHYAVLGLPSGIEGTKISESEIRKAYKAKALRYHPDKRPDDPTAAARFMTIQTSYEILVDVSARKAYDDLLKLKHEQQQRQNQVSAKRRKMMDKLEEEERAFASNAKSQAEMDIEEIERAKKKIEEEIARILSMKAKQASSTFSKKEHVGNNAPQPVSLDKSKIIEVTWCHSKDVSDVQRLYELFGKFGVVEDVVIRSKKALVVMASRDSVVSATKSFFVDDLNALRIRPLCPVTTVSSSPFEEKLDDVPEYSNLVGSAFHAHEESILQKLKQAAERQKAEAQSRDASSRQS
ncbi:uncharacterized protein LOC116251592 isoform X2 [Nymphaea colorata]|nr:uncharacterized protein LOC116251592 isoform X2 [Nymphaea colorata]